MKKSHLLGLFGLLAAFSVFGAFSMTADIDKAPVNEPKMSSTGSETKNWHKLEAGAELAVHGAIFLKNKGRAELDFYAEHGIEKRLNKRVVVFKFRNPARARISLELTYNPKEFMPMLCSKYIFIEPGKRSKRGKLIVTMTSLQSREPPEEISFLMVYNQ